MRKEELDSEEYSQAREETKYQIITNIMKEAAYKATFGRTKLQ